MGVRRVQSARSTRRAARLAGENPGCGARRLLRLVLTIGVVLAGAPARGAAAPLEPEPLGSTPRAVPGGPAAVGVEAGPRRPAPDAAATAGAAPADPDPVETAAGALPPDAAAVPTEVERSAPPEEPRSVADLDLDELAKVRVSPFDVSTGLDRGYRASNSVTGSRFDAPIGELPFAIQAFTGSFIEDQKPVNLFDVARYSPGVTYRSNDFNEGNANLAIRGFTVSTTPAGVQVLRDGFVGPPILDFTDVARVEVVKGPASFLYGQIAPGGVVNVITKRPQPELAAAAAARYGSYDQYRLDVDVTGPLARTLFARVPASLDHDLRYWKPYDARSWDAAPSVLWQPHRRVSVSASYERFHRYESPQVMQKPGYNTWAGVTPSPSDPNKSGVDVPGLPDDWNSMSLRDYRRSDTGTLGAWIDVEVDDHWDLRAGYSHLTSDIDMLFSGNLGMANNTTLIQGRRFRKQTYAQRADTGELGAIGTYPLGVASLRLLVGAQLMERRFDARAAQAPNDPALGTDPIGSPVPPWDLGDPSTWDRNVDLPLSALTATRSDYTVRYRDASGYAGTTFGLLDDRVLVLAGWRLTSTASRYTDNVAGQAQPRITARVVTPQYGVLVKLIPGVSLFATYAESFVPGTVALRNPDETTRAPVPTRGQGYDAGVKADLLGGRLSGTVAVFDLRNRHIVTDLASTGPSGTTVITQLQAGEQRSRGVEVDVTVTPSDGWQLYASYSYMDARITEFTGHDAELLAQDPSTLDAAGQANYKNALRFHGAPLQMSAPHLANLWTKYTVARGPLADAYLGVGVNHVRDQTLLPDTPRWARQTYSLVNAQVGYAWRWRPLRVNVELMGKNLAGERYRPSQSTRARPRELLLTLAARY